MKKKILFVTQYLHTGGIEKSLLTLLADLDYRQYDVDLLLFDYSGVLFKMVPSQVTILPPLFETFSTSFFEAVPSLIKAGKYRLLLGKFLAAGLSLLSPGIGTGIRWAVYRRILPSQKNYYDIAISYIDFFCNYYVAEKVTAGRKIVYNHMDYAYSQQSGWPCPRLERKSFSKSDYIVTVAESSRQSLERFFPEFTQKIQVIHNRVDPNTIRAMANDRTVFATFEKTKTLNIVTVARLVTEKGVLSALEACEILIRQGFQLKWFLIGSGPLYQALQDRIATLGIDDYFILLGEQENPYPYMGQCDLYVQPSKTEAHCVAVEEAMALGRPIVATDIPAFNDQIEQMETGLLVPPTPKGIAEGIKQLMNSAELRKGFMKKVNASSNRSQEELLKFYHLIEDVGS